MMFSSHSRSSKAPLSLVESAAWALIGNVALRGGQWLTLVALAWVGSPAVVGEYGFATAVCAPIVMLLGMQLGLILTADTSHKEPFIVYWRLRMMACLATPLLAAAFTLTLGKSSNLIVFVTVFAVARSLEGLGELVQGRIRRADRLDLLARIQLVRAIATAGVFAIVFYVTNDLLQSVAATAVVSLGCLLLLDIPVANAVDPPRVTESLAFQNKALWQLARKAAPLGASAMVISLHAYIPLLFVEAFAGKAPLGVLVAVMSLPMVAETVVRSGLQATIPRLATRFSKGEEASFWRLHRASLLGVAVLAGLMTGIVALVGDQLVLLLFPADFGCYPGLLFWTMVAASLGFVSNSTPSLIAAGCYRIYLNLWLVGLAVLIAGALALVPKFGVYGAAYALVLANGVRLVMTVALMKPVVSAAFNAHTVTNRPQAASQGSAAQAA